MNSWDPRSTKYYSVRSSIQYIFVHLPCNNLCSNTSLGNFLNSSIIKFYRVSLIDILIVVVPESFKTPLMGLWDSSWDRKCLMTPIFVEVNCLWCMIWRENIFLLYLKVSGSIFGFYIENFLSHLSIFLSRALVSAQVS